MFGYSGKDLSRYLGPSERLRVQTLGSCQVRPPNLITLEKLLNRGTPIETPKYYSPYYGHTQRGTPNFRKPPYGCGSTEGSVCIPEACELQLAGEIASAASESSADLSSG